MRIIKMRGSFGKLKGDLSLQEGMNVLTLPNEEGKSTWTAFIIAMLYGIDTKERGNQGNGGLPAKERYRPWDGSPMEGSMDLEWKGRYITIERKSTPKAPMSIFRAYDTASGKVLGALSGENCGRTLCGVERSVFERTAFIRQLGIAVNPDDSLDRRLGALVSTGEEQGKSAPQLEKELQVLKNRLAGRNGLIPKLQTELTEAEQRCTSIHKLQEEINSLEAEKTRLENSCQVLADTLERVALAKEAQGQIAVGELGQKLKEQEQLCSNLEDMVVQLPPRPRIQELHRKAEEIQKKLDTAKMEEAFAPSPGTRPQAPSYFTGLTVAQAEQQIRKDMEGYAKLSRIRPVKKFLPLFLSFSIFAIPVALIALMYFDLLPFSLPLPVLVGVGAAGLTLFLILWVILQRKSLQYYRKRLESQQILGKYRAEKISELPELLEAYTGAQKKYEEEASLKEEEVLRLTAITKEAQEEAESLMAEISAFAPECTDLAQGRQFLAEAVQTLSNMDSEKRELENRRKQYENIRKLFGDEDRQIDYEALRMDENKLRYDHRVEEQKFRTVAERLAALKGRMEATGSASAMEARKQTLRKQLLEAREKLRTVELAQEVLDLADHRIRSRFSPQITMEAGRILGQLTRGKYPAMQLSPDMQLSVRDGVLQRPLAAMSCGTGDQMYLALRLAMCRKLLPQDAPLILDDALVNFDNDRCDAAVELLSEEARKRQVILFTCRTL